MQKYDVIGIYSSIGTINPSDFIKYLLIYGACLGPPEYKQRVMPFLYNVAKRRFRLYIKYIDTKAERSYFITCLAIHLWFKLRCAGTPAFNGIHTQSNTSFSTHTQDKTKIHRRFTFTHTHTHTPLLPPPVFTHTILLKVKKKTVYHTANSLHRKVFYYREIQRFDSI